MRDSSLRVLRTVANGIGSSLPQAVLLRMERFAATHQGKGVVVGHCDQEVKQCAELLGRVPRTVLDVGGNRGEYAAAVRQCFPECSIHVFEPSPECATQLRCRFDGDLSVVIHEVAVSDEAGERVLWTVEAGSALASLTRRRLEHVGLSMDQSSIVRSIRLDDLVQSGALVHVDWIKIDVEGHELAVLQGARSLLGSVSLVQFEFGGCNIDTRSFFRDYWYLFTDLGFRLFRLTARRPVPVWRYEEILEHFRTTNYVAVRK
jgi:FkbM family methyltransferase